MTMGEKIRYFRTKRGITQGKLAVMSDIHPVTIRKYETGMAQPQPSQIEKIANALNISVVALLGTDKIGLRLKTLGDFMGVFMALCSADIFKITGLRGSYGFLINDTVKLESRLDDITLDENKYVGDLVRWERLNYLCKSNDSPEIDLFRQEKESLEVELQSSNEKLEFYYF